MTSVYASMYANDQNEESDGVNKHDQKNIAYLLAILGSALIRVYPWNRLLQV